MEDAIECFMCKRAREDRAHSPVKIAIIAPVHFILCGSEGLIVFMLPSSCLGVQDFKVDVVNRLFLSVSQPESSH